MSDVADILSEVERPRWLIGIVLLALLVRLVYISTVRDVPRFPDSNEYISYARHLVEDGTFQNRSGERATRSPGYPLFLSVFFGTFGENLFLIRIVQALIDTVSILLLFLLLRILGYRFPAYVASFLMSIYPTTVFMTGAILTETLFTFGLLLGTYLLFLYIFRDRDPPALAGAGLVFGGTALIHPSTLLVFPVYLFFLLLLRMDSEKKKNLWIGAAVFLAVLFPWTIRNQVVIGQPTPGTTKSGQDLYEAFGPGATGGPRGETDFLPGEIHRMDDAERNRYLLVRAMTRMLGDSQRTLRLAVAKFTRTWTPFPNAPSYRTWPYNVVLPIAYLTVLLGAALSFFSARQGRHLLLLLIPVVYIALVHVMFIGSIRYRIPVMPYLIALAGIGWAAFLRTVTRR